MPRHPVRGDRVFYPLPPASAGREAEGSGGGSPDSRGGTDESTDGTRKELDRLSELGVDLVERHVYQLAGLVGVDPGPFTWRQLDWMTEQRSRAGWDHTASILTILANVNSVKTKFELADFHPYLERAKRSKMSVREYLKATQELDKQRR